MKPLFEEKQRFDQWWLWLLVTIVSIIVISTFGRGMYIQFYEGTPWGDNPMNNDTLLIVSLFSVTLVLLVLLFFVNSVLETRVDVDGFTYRYFPIIRQWQRIHIEQIQRIERSTNRMTGYGVKQGIDGRKFFTVKGTEVVEIYLKDGSILVFGTQRTNELITTLQKIKSSSN